MDMVATRSCKHGRVLVVDDNEEIHNDFRRIFSDEADSSYLDALLTGFTPQINKQPSFDITYAYQGTEAVEHVLRAVQDGVPFSLAFVDVRMPPGLNGIETLSRIWEHDPSLQAVICSAYSDTPWEELTRRFGQTSRLLILKKPFDPIEVRQAASALTQKWIQERENAQIQSDLRRSEEKSRRILQTMPDTILLVTRDGTWRSENMRADTAIHPQTGTASKGAIGEVLPAEVARQVMHWIEQAPNHNVSHIIEYQQDADGQSRHVEARIAAIDVTEAIVVLRDVTERKRIAAETEQKRIREEMLRAQAEFIRELSTPLIPITGEIVILPLVGALDVQRMQQAKMALCHGISLRGISIAILDITGVKSLSLEVANEILCTAQEVRLLGAEAILTGIQPIVAGMLIEMGLDMRGIRTHRTLQSAVAFAMRAH